jgi:DNA repair exonuclease SbcCD nuclease subunit
MNEIINVPFNKLRRIIHLADIHIRLFKRHDEYKKCFERLYNELKKSDLSETIILVAGDVVHAKTDLSPEMVEMASDFLNSLANLAPTILITGNHDLNLANANRLDSLTPIVKSLNNPNLFYLKYSGIYECADVDFYVYSIIGDRANWPVPQSNDRTKIALFHGPVHNAQTDVGYTITNRHVTIETFDGFDMVLLGDIHRAQTLQNHSIEEIVVNEEELEFYLKNGWIIY